MTYKGWENYAGPLAPQAKARRKFNNEPTTIDSVVFASQREANRYLLLRDQCKRGEISNLELQPKFSLHVMKPNGVKVEIGTYRADFRYEREGKIVVEDAKGMKTESYAMRKRHVEAEYNIVILET